MPVTFQRKTLKLLPDPRRVIARYHRPAYSDRVQAIFRQVLGLSGEERQRILARTLRRFSGRHRNISRIFEKHCERILREEPSLGEIAGALSEEQRLLLGSYFTAEYAIESTAFYNPSIVEDPDQSELQNGEKRLIISFRATGEGHISSIVFRRGIIDAGCDIHLEEPGSLVDMPETVNRHVYDKTSFLEKLEEMRIRKDVIAEVAGRLADQFVYGELQASIEETLQDPGLSYTKKNVVHAINWLALSHYEVTFSRDTNISERVLFPVSYAESNGIEDARFVRFLDTDGSATYYATYTAYNGYAILPKLMETKDFYHFKVMPLHGEYAQNKGLSLFPRRIRGRYAMIGRCDGTNLYIMYSDNLNLWREAIQIQKPRFPWEFVQVGNAGSPLETEEGWLLITHGVGPVRSYSLGATLLDLDDPSRVIGRLKEPILTPNDEEREGYVPNVVYSCGSYLHNGNLIVPYGMADYASAFGCVSLRELLEQVIRS
jgi:predicted GH43/DUF377 family glycosyl hydrolase